MNIYKRLIIDHEKQRALCRRLLGTEGDSPDRRAFWEELKVELEAHALAEEQTFYAGLMAQPEATERVRHSISEHQDVACVVKELEEADMATGAWLTLMKKLAHEVEHHLDEEENEIFPMAKALFSHQEAEEMADRFSERKPVEVRKENAA